ncbi:HEAT repeat protein [Xylariomycetidae sp. FL2044]|nr:HEAT repeat protein [Xylariomycetidae sp. FL2044]
MASDPSAARTELFKQLKPRCVSILNLAVRSTDKKANAKELIEVVQDLSRLLQEQIARDSSVLDEKIVDYVFFPLSSILRNQHEFPIRLTEVTLRCIRILIQYGWKSKIPKDLAQQFLILLPFIIGGVPGQERKTSIPEETELEAFKTLTALVRASGSSPTNTSALVETDSIPSLGHAVSVVLDGITGGRTPEIQLEALETLGALISSIKDQTALATFLPGIVSSLSRLLAPPASLKAQRKVLVGGIAALRHVLTRVLGDIKLMAILKKQPEASSEESSGGKVLSRSWLKASSAKVKLALASVLKLRNHGHDEVRSALDKLCIALLDECHESLAECVSILVESAMILSTSDESRSLYDTSLTDLARIYPELGDTIKTTIYNWVTSMPRIMQSSDERIKQQAIQNLLKGQSFISTLQIDSSILDDSLAMSLRDSTTALILASQSGAVMSELPSSDVELKSTDLITDEKDSYVFRPVLVAQEPERVTRSTLLDFLAKVGPPSQQVKLASDMIDYVRESTGPSQIASYWLAFELMKSVFSHTSELDDFLDLSSVDNASDERESVFQELYSYSVAVLDTQVDMGEVDWRFAALALEVTTFSASRMQESFRPELIDVLYPIATFLGSSVPQLREHAIVSLNSISASCGYSNVTDLIIDNVDYMVNSVSLRLNTFDISPASTQVLRMMIKLTGPKLIPYLDDVVASIFAALDNYHGYTLFVESLFSVLTEVAQQGTQSETLLLEDAKSSAVDHRKEAPKTTSTGDLCDILDARIERRNKRKQEEFDIEEIEPHPKRPWKMNKTTDDPTDQEANEEGGDPNSEVEKPKPPKTPTYNVLTRITNLTQHYLTSPTPTLRKSLLDLLATVCPALSPDEESFLPLVNSIWPVLIERLYDPEPFVVAAACEALSSLCQSAGDFLGTRFKTEWWDNLGAWCRKVKAEATGGSSSSSSRGKSASGRIRGGGDKGGKRDQKILIPIRSSAGALLPQPSTSSSVLSSSISALSLVDPNTVTTEIESERSGITAQSYTGLGRFAQASRTWEAVRGLLVALVSHVRVDDDIFDQVLDLLAETLDADRDAREALERVDADAVWLVRYERGLLRAGGGWLARPVMEEVGFVEV